MRKRATAKDVALKVGVSRSAVSRAFTPGAKINKSKRDKILSVASEIGYRPNAMARSLIKQHSELVAIVSGNMGNIYDNYFLEHLEHRLQLDGKWSLLVRCKKDENIARTLAEALSYPVQAVIVRAGSVDQTIIDQCRLLNVPLIFSGYGGEINGADSIWCDSAAGAHLAVEKLVKRGCTNIAYIGGKAGITSEEARRKGFQDSMKTFGLDSHSICNGDFDFESGYEQGLVVLQKTERPDGIFCVNDAVALGVLNAAKYKFRLDVPDQLAVVGFDDIPMASWPMFDLSTVTNPIDVMAEAILDTLNLRLKKPDTPDMSVIVKPDFVVRGSA